MTAVVAGWTDASAIGYPALLGSVLLGSIVPVIPTGPVVAAAAALAVTTDHLSLPLVLVLATAGALLGDVVTFGVARTGSEAGLRVLVRGQPPERLATARTRFAEHGCVLVVIGRLVPAGRIPALLAAAALGYPWRRLVPAALAGCVLWAVAYAAIGILSGGLFDDPVLASLLAAVLVLAVAAVVAPLTYWWRRRRGSNGRSDAS